MNEKDLEIQELKMKIKKLEEEKEAVLEYVEKLCVYDEHLQGYCFNLSKGKVRTLMYKLKEK